MKKFGSFALAALMVTALGVSASATTFKAATGTPTIDGKMDDAYKAAEEIKINIVTSGDGKTTGTARTLWDDKNLYVFFDITDPIISEKFATKEGNYCYYTDSVEFFIDLSGAKAGSKLSAVNAGQYTVPGAISDAPNTIYGGGKHQAANKANASFKSVKTDKGYAVELQVPFGVDYTPKADAQIGVVYHINSDENGKEEREGEIFAGKDQGSAWDTTANYDTLILSADKYVAPAKPAAAKTADMGIIAAVASLAASGAAVLSLKKRK